MGSFQNLLETERCEAYAFRALADLNVATLLRDAANPDNFPELHTKTIEEMRLRFSIFGDCLEPAEMPAWARYIEFEKRFIAARRELEEMLEKFPECEAKQGLKEDLLLGFDAARYIVRNSDMGVTSAEDAIARVSGLSPNL